MKLLHWVKYGKIINVIILIKLLKDNILFYIAIYVFEQFSFILLSMF